MPPLNLMYWSGDFIGKKYHNPRYATTIREMIKRCDDLKFNRRFNTSDNRQCPDIIIISEIFPPSGNGSIFDKKIADDPKKEVQYLGYNVGLYATEGSENEYFLVAYNRFTIHHIETNKLFFAPGKKCLLEIHAYMSDDIGKPIDRPYKIIALHIEGSDGGVIKNQLINYVKNRHTLLDDVHAIIGDTNYDNDTKFQFHNGMSKLTLENDRSKYGKKYQYNRCWVAEKLIDAQGIFLNYKCRHKTYNFPNPNNSLSDHPAMAISLALR